MGEGGEEQGVVTDDFGNVNVEPGSSYLAVLAMTGLSGATGMGVFLLWIAAKWFGRWRFLPAGQAAQLLGAGAFMGVNGIAEGWVLAVGSPLCLIFWLWLGQLVDSVDSVQKTEVSGRKSAGSRRNKKSEIRGKQPKSLALANISAD
jgi:O-antigen ligase